MGILCRFLSVMWVISGPIIALCGYPVFGYYISFLPPLIFIIALILYVVIRWIIYGDGQ